MTSLSEMRQGQLGSLRAEPLPQGVTKQVQILPVRPIVTVLLIAINVFIFALLRDTANLLGGVYRPAIVSGEVYRLLTSVFMHVSIDHLLVNMIALYFIGRTVERYIGHVRFSVIYFGGGLVGSLFSYWFNPSDFFYSVGASGAIFAVFAAEVFYLYKYRQPLSCEITPWELAKATFVTLLLGIFLPRLRDHDEEPHKELKYSVAMILIGAVAGFIPNSGVDNWGHLGGLVGGLILSWLLAPLFTISLNPNEPNTTPPVLINTPSGQFRFFSGALFAFIGLLVLTAIPNIAPVLKSASDTTYTVENLTFTAPPGSQILSHGCLGFEPSPGLTCLFEAVSVSSQEPIVVVLRITGPASQVSLKEADESVAAAISEGVGSSPTEMKIDGRNAIQRVYQVDQTSKLFLIVRDGDSLLMLVGNRSSTDGALDAIIASLRFTSQYLSSNSSSFLGL